MLRAVSFIEDDKGAAMVEFAIASTVFVVILLGILEFGFAAWAKNSVAADAREGARYAMVRGTTSGRIATTDSVSNYVKSKTNLGNSIVVVTTWNPDNTPGSTVTVKVRYAVPRRGPFLPARTDSSTSTQVVIY
jgi:Flp pilus assembly protein TadG